MHTSSVLSLLVPRFVDLSKSSLTQAVQDIVVLARRTKAKPLFTEPTALPALPSSLSYLHASMISCRRIDVLWFQRKCPSRWPFRAPWQQRHLRGSARLHPQIRLRQAVTSSYIYTWHQREKSMKSVPLAYLELQGHIT